MNRWAFLFMGNWLRKFDGNDALFFGGLVILAVGVGLVTVPGALASVGGILLVAGLLGALRGSR